MSLGANQTGNVAVIVATTPKNNQYQAGNAPHNAPWVKAVDGIGLAGFLLFLIPQRRRLSNLAGVIVLALLSLSAITILSGCGRGGGNQYPGTPAGASTLTVTATSGSITQTQTIALTVNTAR